jgi:hypothetical protein
MAAFRVINPAEEPEDGVIRSVEDLQKALGIPVFTGDREGIEALADALIKMRDVSAQRDKDRERLLQANGGMQPEDVDRVFREMEEE